MSKQMIAISKIIIDEDSQIRVKTNEEMLNAYTEILQDNKGKWVFPPLAVVEIDGEYHLSDGHHRLQAARNIDLQEVPVEIVGNSKRDQFVNSCLTNRKNGIALTSADRRKMARMACLFFPEKTLTELGEIVGYSPSRMKDFRDELVEQGELVLPEVVVGKDGKSRKPKNKESAGPDNESDGFTEVKCRNCGFTSQKALVEASDSTWVKFDGPLGKEWFCSDDCLQEFQTKEMENAANDFLEENGEECNAFKLPPNPSAALKFYNLKLVFRVSTEKMKIQAKSMKEAVEQVRKMAQTNSIRLDWDIEQIEE